MSDGLTEMAPAWGAPAWLAQALALYIADGGEIDLDLWRACVAASRAERTGWTDEARARSVEVRRDRQAEHDREAVAVIRTRRQAGLSWSAVAAELTAAALPPPRRPSRDRHRRMASRCASAVDEGQRLAHRPEARHRMSGRDTSRGPMCSSRPRRSTRSNRRRPIRKASRSGSRYRADRA